LGSAVSLNSAAYATTSEVQGTNTTGTITTGTNSLTVASATGINVGDFVVGEGIAPGTTVSAISGTTITLSGVVGATLSADPVAFFIANKALSPGLVSGQLCRAWVNFNGTGTVAIRASFNVSSVTNLGDGDYEITFTTAMPDGNYAVVGMTDRSNSGGASISIDTSNAPGTSSFKIHCFNDAGSLVDGQYVSVAVFR
jgi:hypothetical protein